MAQVIASSKHGQQQLNHGGVKFFRSGGMTISEEISDEKAEEFLATPDHYKRYQGDPIEPPTAKRAAQTPATRPAPGVAKTNLSTAQDASSPTF
jgi:hypothetical protein